MGRNLQYILLVCVWVGAVNTVDSRAEPPVLHDPNSAGQRFQASAPVTTDRDFHLKWGIRVYVNHQVEQMYGRPAAVRRADAFMQSLTPQERQDVSMLYVANGLATVSNWLFKGKISVYVPMNQGFDAHLAEFRSGRIAVFRQLQNWLQSQFQPQQLSIGSAMLSELSTPEQAQALAHKVQKLAPAIRFISRWTPVQLVGSMGTPYPEGSNLQHVPVLRLPYHLSYEQLSAMIAEHFRRLFPEGRQ